MKTRAEKGRDSSTRPPGFKWGSCVVSKSVKERSCLPAIQFGSCITKPIFLTPKHDSNITLPSILGLPVCARESRLSLVST